MDKAIILIAAAVLAVIPAIGFYKIGEALEQIERDEMKDKPEYVRSKERIHDGGRRYG